jgi:hypothetical protein
MLALESEAQQLQHPSQAIRYKSHTHVTKVKAVEAEPMMLAGNWSAAERQPSLLWSDSKGEERRTKSRQ